LGRLRHLQCENISRINCNLNVRKKKDTIIDKNLVQLVFNFTEVFQYFIRLFQKDQTEVFKILYLEEPDSIEARTKKPEGPFSCI
jgi:hypothetical protein